MAGEADAPDGYVRPKVLTEEEHEEHVHLCGLIPPVNCIGCPVVTQIACLREHTTDTSLARFPASMSLEERLLAYWKGIPLFVGEEVSEEENPFIV